MQVLLWIICLCLLAVIATCLLLWRIEHRRLEASQALRHQLDLRIKDLEADQQSKVAAGEKTEEKLRRYLRLMDALINTIPNPIYFKDRNGVFQGCNKMFARTILGLTRDRIIGRRHQDLSAQIPPGLAARYQREELKMFEKGGVHSFEAPVYCADGTQRDFFFSLAPVLESNDQAGGWVAVLVDLTEKNQALSDRLEKEKLESVLETAGAVCHELNQPLQALSGYAELLAAQLHSAPAGPGIGEYVTKMMDQILRMRDITDKLQGITRYETMDYAGNSKIINIHQSTE